MRRSRFSFLILAAVVGTAATAAAADGGSTNPPPSLEYRPQRVVIPEPKAPTPAPPVTVFRESIGGFGIATESFDKPVDVAFDADGNVFVLDAGNNRVQMFDRFLKFVLTFGTVGSRNGEFSKPRAILVDSTRAGFAHIYVLDAGNHRVQVFQFEKKTGKVSFFADWGSLGSREGSFKDPRDFVLDGDGNLWVLDSGNERVQMFRFDPDQKPRFCDRGKLLSPMVCFLGTWGKEFGSRGGVFDGQVSIAWSRDRFGYVYLLGAGCVVQQFQLDGTLVNTWTAIAPESGLCSPGRIEIDNKNDYVYLVDSGNSLFERYNLEGRFLAAWRGADRPFANPLGLAVNPDRDDVLVADTGNNIVQKFTLR